MTLMRTANFTDDGGNVNNDIARQNSDVMNSTMTSGRSGASSKAAAKARRRLNYSTLQVTMVLRVF